ncbi:MAG: segregation and condensation protein A [Terriglobales bacterium]
MADQIQSGPHRPDKDTEFPFSVSVGEVYDGPLDLLLDLIRKQNINIYDIPIAQITAQYLTYVERIKQLDVNVAAEFIFMASVLIQIKSRMLLPRDPTLSADQQEDPRAELVNRLLEHERFRTAAQMLMQKQQIEEAVWSNPASKEFKGQEGTEPELAADVVDLVKVFQRVLERARTRPVIDVNEETVTVSQMMAYFKRVLALDDRPVRLMNLLGTVHSRQALICAFLALLEMVRLQAVLLRQERVFGDIVLKKNAEFEKILEQQAAVRDDWK